VAVESKQEILTALQRIVGSVPDRQIREARIALREAEIRLLNCRQKLTNLGFQIGIDEFSNRSDAERVSSLQVLGLPPELVNENEMDVAATSSNLLPLTASFDGMVIRQDANVGESVDAGRPILEIADVRRMSIRLSVPKEFASRLKLGMAVEFLPDGAAEPVQGMIDWISTEVDPQSRTLHARVDVENPAVESGAGGTGVVPMLRAHTFGKGTIIVGQTPHARVVPRSAVLQSDAQAMVFVQTGERSFERVDVSVGVREGDVVEVRDCDLRPGQQVVVAGGHVLKSESTLRPGGTSP